jgi:hypothetical protein
VASCPNEKYRSHQECAQQAGGKAEIESCLECARIAICKVFAPHTHDKDLLPEGRNYGE